ncbi:MAG: acylneuraminate cytidylyltransferase family protein [bacterium]
MIKNKSVICIIPARGGSKGVAKKNIKFFLGKPLINWTISEAKKSKYIDSLIVSTDDEKTAFEARKAGAEVPFKRPKYLARDQSPMIDVILHAENWLKTRGSKYDVILLLQPTSPLRTAEDIDSALKLFISKKAESVVSVCAAEHHPYLSNRIDSDKRMKGFLKLNKISEYRQGLPRFYRVNGAIYIAYGGYLRKHKSFFGNKTFAYIMPPERSVDIDSQNDFDYAEYLKKKSGDDAK